MIKLFIYDLDGTLVDTREDIVLAANHMRSQMTLPALASEEVSGHVGRGVHHLISHCLKTSDPKKIEKGIKIYREYYAQHMMDHSRLYPGAKEMLEFYRDRAQVVLTNKPNPFSKEMLAALHVADYFKEIIAGDSEYPKKPSAGAVKAMMERFSAGPQETLFVGDSLVDIETAKNAGIPIVVLTHGFSTLRELQSAAPDALVGNFGELRKWMERKSNQ